MNGLILPAIVFLLNLFPVLVAQGPEVSIPVPSPAQLRYQQYERIMFVCLDPCTWQGREYDNHSVPLSRINPEQLKTDQWCRVAKSWGARLILFVAKHTGGFCWWQTETSDYGIRNTPWRDGKGDVLKDLSASCRKYGLDLGIYVYPGDDNWGAGIGSGGKTADPSKQAAYNEVYRRQMTEVLTKYGPVREVWFDGSCVIDVSDMLKEYAGDAVILQGPMANIRWVGNEDGIAPYPNWYTLKRSDLATGVSTALHSDPSGDAYAPVEMDVPLLKNGGHKWFWAPGTDKLILGTGQLMDLYYRSVGRGGVLLLNSTPDTTGLIPASHVKAYQDFGSEISKRFGRPIKTVSGVGKELTIKFKRPTQINHAVIRENLAKGQLIRSYILEGLIDGNWFVIREGSSVGQKRIEFFNPVMAEGIRIRILESAGDPEIIGFSVFNVESPYFSTDSGNPETPVTLGSWNSDTYSAGWKQCTLDLTPFIDDIAQYEIRFEVISYDWTTDWGMEFKDARLEMYGKVLPQALEQVNLGGTFRITRSQQTDKPGEFPVLFSVFVRSKPGRSFGNIELRRIRHE